MFVVIRIVFVGEIEVYLVLVFSVVSLWVCCEIIVIVWLCVRLFFCVVRGFGGGDVLVSVGWLLGLDLEWGFWFWVCCLREN